MTSSLNLYIHIPFCQSKCLYCHFYSNVNKGSYIDKYFQTLINEINIKKRILKNYQISTIYFGGGTPSLPKAKYIQQILNFCRLNLNFTNNIEITLEANPETLNKEKLHSYLESGVNRLSLGLQTTDDILLKQIGRHYTFEKFKKILKLAQYIGFKNINLDLIFGLPKQTLSDWQTTLNKVLNLNIQHLSCYSLELDNNSTWGKLYKKKKLTSADENLDRKMYCYTVKTLKNAGFKQYEISNFAKQGFECRHNLDFWLFKSYLGLGAGAYSFFENTRFHNPENLGFYQKQVKNNFNLKVREINQNQLIKEAIIINLRLLKGIDIKQFNQRFKIDLLKKYKNQINDLVCENLLKVNKSRVKLTKIGIDLYNQVIQILI